MFTIGVFRFISWLFIASSITGVTTYLFMKYKNIKGIITNLTDLEPGELNFLSHIYKKDN